MLASSKMGDSVSMTELAIEVAGCGEESLRPVKHQFDNAGIVWISRNAVYRRISPDYKEAALKFLNSELFEDLVSNRLFPETKVVQSSNEAGGLVLEHKRAPFILYAWEWSFSMLKDAIYTILSVADLCEKHEYHLQDSHVYNVVFFSGHPMGIDFGSFREGKGSQSFPQEELLRHGYLPLKLWSEGHFYIANCLQRDLLDGRRLQPFTVVEGSPLFHEQVQPFIRQKDSKYWLKRLANMAMWRIPGMRNQLFDWSRYGKVDYSAEEMRQRIKPLLVPATKTEWEGYHDANYFVTGEVSQRFNRIMQILSDVSWETAVDVAGNSGFFTELLARRFPDARFLCLDYDSRAIESQYCRIRGNNDISDRITTGMVNLMYPECRLLQLENRVRADLVLALALTHHLLLRQNADINIILQLFGRITRRYLAIEFMPLGLWNGKTTKAVPAWYTQEWFKNRLEAHFHVLIEEQLEPNRILFLCERDRAEMVGGKTAQNSGSSVWEAWPEC